MENQPAPTPDAAPAAEDDPLAFTPVPRRTNRADGLNADIQRNFIAILACCGSPRRAAKAVGKAAFGFEQLRSADGAESFNRAWDAAIAMFKEQEARRVAINADIVRNENAAWRPAHGAFATAASRAHLLPPPELTEQQIDQQEKDKWADFLDICTKYHRKLEAERRCRLAGRIAEADFYVRQITWLECALDAVSGDGMKLLKDYRAHGHDLRTIAETPMSRLLGDLRRAHFEDCGDPPWPEHPPRHLLDGEGEIKVVPVHPARPDGMDWRAHEASKEAQYLKDAAAQLEWEAQARADAAAWRAEPNSILAALIPAEPDEPPLSSMPDQEGAPAMAAAKAGEGLTANEEKD